MPILLSVTILFLSGCVNIHVNQFYPFQESKKCSEVIVENNEIIEGQIGIEPIIPEIKPQMKPNLPSEKPTKIRFQDLVPFMRNHEIFNQGLIEELTPITLESQLGIFPYEIDDSFGIKSISESEYNEIIVIRSPRKEVEYVRTKIEAYHQKNLQLYPQYDTIRNAKWVIVNEDTIIYVATGNHDEWIHQIKSFV